MAILLFISVLLIAACGLVYELIAGTLASYLLGDSVLQFSTVIGSYLFAMGIGSALSRFLHRGLAYRFVWVELAVALLGGLEIPLLMRIVRGQYSFRDAVAHVLTFDYLGALGASLLFPLLLVPKLGLVRSAMLFGVVNAAVALWSTYLFARRLPAARGLRVACGVVLCLL